VTYILWTLNGAFCPHMHVYYSHWPRHDSISMPSHLDLLHSLPIEPITLVPCHFDSADRCSIFLCNVCIQWHKYMMVHYVNTSGSKDERNSKDGLNYWGVTPRQTTVPKLGLCTPAAFFLKKGKWSLESFKELQLLPMYHILLMIFGSKNQSNIHLV